MKVYKTQSAVEKDIKDGVLTIEGDVRFECSISILASINVICGDIDAENIDAGNINARDINAWDINARDINARDILYYAFCSVYNSVKCLSIKARREVYSEPICLDGELIIKTEPKETIKIGNNTYNKEEVETALKDVKSL